MTSAIPLFFFVFPPITPFINQIIKSNGSVKCGQWAYVSHEPWTIVQNHNIYTVLALNEICANKSAPNLSGHPI